MAFTVIKGVGTYPLASSKTEEGETGSGECTLHPIGARGSTFVAVLGGDVDKYHRGTWVCMRCLEMFEYNKQGRLW